MSTARDDASPVALPRPTRLTRVAHALEKLGGSRELSPNAEARAATSVGLAALWLFYLLLAVAFAGRTAKFIYIDF